MPTLDIALPMALLLVVTVAFFLNKRAEKKLKDTIETKEFQTNDLFMFVGVLAVVISVIALTTFINSESMFENILLGIFLGTYTMLLFTLTHIYSDIKKKRAQLFSIGFGAVSLIAGVASLLAQFKDSFTLFRCGAFFGLAVVCFVIAIYEQKKDCEKKVNWKLAIQPPALFLLFFVFFNILHTDGTLNIWYPYLLDIFGAVFAILIIIYLNSLFSWKTVGIFAVLLTIIDVILVFSGPMVVAAKTFTGLGLPALIYLPNFPFVLNEPGIFTIDNMFFRGLGLGDFFFAGILAIQTFKRFGKNYAYAAIAAMVVSFGIWDAYLPEITAFFGISGFPATVCIITGWIPIVLVGLLLHKKQEEPLASLPVTELSDVSL
ncbi:MAG: hypothetical protein FWH37_02320 [Candidatus Bathyarchaeota archaeon]|nr:hypothetical protein [Candidatus Termiticorpusculum sp.]